MLRVVVLTLGLLTLPATLHALCTGPSFADVMTAEERAAVEAEIATMPYPEGLIWRAERDDRSLVVVGTMHAWDPRHEPLLAEVAPHLATAQVLLVEAGPDEQDEMLDTLSRDTDRLMIGSGPTLPEMMPDAEWEALARAAEARGLPGFMAARMQPWYLALTLAIPPCAMSDMAAGLGGLDQLLIEAALDRGLPIRSLETWETVIDVFANNTMDEQLDLLRFTAGPPELQSLSFAAMLDGYFSGRIAEVWAISRQATYRIPELTRAEADAIIALTQSELLTRRNRAWIEVIEASDAREAMVAVGALHLPGETGVLSLLGARGWTITPL